MKIYFAASIRAGREKVTDYKKITDHLKKYGTVLTEHVADKKLTSYGSKGPSDTIHDNDLKMLLSADVVVAEVSVPSLGVGYEIAKAEDNNKKTLCLYMNQEDKKLSAMIDGSRKIKVVKYDKLDEALSAIDIFMGNLTPKNRK